MSFLTNSLKSGVFPDTWKVAVVAPVHKTLARKMVSNYKPVSPLCTLSEMFESVVHLFTSFSLRNGIIPNQRGFMSGRSLTTSLVSFISTAPNVVCDNYRLSHLVLSLVSYRFLQQSLVLCHFRESEFLTPKHVSLPPIA